MSDTAEKSTDPQSVRAFLRASKMVGRTAERAIRMAAIQFGEEFAAAVREGISQGWYANASVRSVHAKVRAFRRELLEEAGVKPIRVPKKADKVRQSIAALIERAASGKRLSALRIVQGFGLDERQARKLAYQTPVSSDDVRRQMAGLGQLPFVRMALADKGWQRTLVASHANLAKFAALLANAQRSVAQHQRQLRPSGDDHPAHWQSRRGEWHSEAISLLVRGMSIADTARTLGRSLDAVRKVARRKT